MSLNPSKVLKNFIQSFNQGKKDLKNFFFQIRKEHGQKQYYPKNLEKKFNAFDLDNYQHKRFFKAKSIRRQADLIPRSLDSMSRALPLRY